MSFSFLGASATPAAQTTATPSLSLGSLTGAVSAPAQLSTGGFTSAASTSYNPTTAAASATNTITFKVMEDHINNWMRDLDEQEKDFLDQACQLNALDRTMIDNGEKIVDLNSEVERLNKEQDKLEQELDFIMTQQNYLEQSIKKLESGIEQMPVFSTQYGDKDRLQTYQLLITIDNQLKTMSNELKDIIERLNASNVNLNDPAVQISKILNAHMDSLSWIEDNTTLIQKQVDHLSVKLDDRIRDHEKATNLCLM